MAQGERAEKKEEAARKVKEDGEPLAKLIPMTTAHRLKDVTEVLAKELPQGITEMR